MSKEKSDKQNPGDDSIDIESMTRAAAAAAAASDEQTEEPACDPTVEVTEESTDSLAQELSAQKDKYLRLMAEFDNYKRRTAREFASLVETANERLMADIVTARESFERALKAGETNPDFQVFFDGMKLIYSQLDTVLTRHGLEVFTEAGDVFDPQIHDALMKIPHETVPEDSIVDVHEKGYRLKGKVIKHARVVVSSGKPE